MGAGRDLFSPAQTRAARALLNWSAERLAEAASLQSEAIDLYEAEAGSLSRRDLVEIGRVLNMHGVIALPPALAGAGVRFRHASTCPAARWQPWL